MKIKIVAVQDADENRVIESPVACNFGDRVLTLGVRQRKTSAGKSDEVPLFTINARDAVKGRPDIAVSACTFPTPFEAFKAWNAGVEVADPKGGTEEGKFVGEMLRQRIAIEVK
jgi:hypothetical protein